MKINVGNTISVVFLRSIPEMNRMMFAINPIVLKKFIKSLLSVILKAISRPNYSC